MNVVFVHDHKFRKVNNTIYSPGGLSNEILTRYTEIFGNVFVIGRIINEKKARVTYSKITNPLVCIETKEMLFKRIKSADAVIIRLPSINGYKAVYFAKKLKKPYLVEVVGCTKDAYLNYGIKGKIFAYPAYYLMKKCVYDSKYTIYVTKEFLEKRYPCKGKSAAISDVALLPQSNKMEEKKNWKDIKGRKKLVLGTLASIDVSYKVQEYVIKAIPDIEKRIGVRLEYQLVGAGDSTRLLNIAQKYGVEDRIVFKGTLPHQEVFQWLDSLDCYIQPSLVEGLSRALIEAMSRGIMCLASNCGGNPELLDPECLIPIKDRDNIPDEIAKILSELYLKEQYVFQSRRNYSIANKYYNEDHLKQLRVEFYSEFKEYAMYKG